jgi:pre-mRNA-splicing factor SYF1
LKEDEIIPMATKYADLEKNMGEIDRARGVYIYASQFTDPRDDAERLWAIW